MDSLFDILDKECKQVKTNFSCIKKYDVKGYVGSYININIVFTVNEHIYLAEMMAGKNLDKYLDKLLMLARSYAAYSSGSSYDLSNIKIKCEFV